MANQKQFVTNFLLAATFSPTFKETFSQAEEALKSLGIDTQGLGLYGEQAGQAMSDAFLMAASSLASSGLSQIVGTMRDAMIDVIETTAEFEHQMSGVAAVSQGTSTEIAQLSEYARELGETTVFTATESGAAMETFAQAGWDVEEIMSGVADALNLAAAGGISISEAANITADTLAGFGMTADETGRMVDVLAQTAANSNTSITALGDTYKNVASIAGALNFTIEDVSVMLGIMADRGVKGQKAGTALRNIFNGLAKELTLTSDAFGEATVSMFDEDGSARTLAETIDDLRLYFGQMTDQEMYSNAEMLAGMRGYNALFAILNATDEEYAAMYETIGQAQGAAQLMAETRLDNLQGDVTLLKSAFDELKISVGDNLTPALRGGVQLLTSITQGASDFAKSAPGAVDGIAGITTGLTVGLGTLTAVAATLKLIKALDFASLLAGPAGWVALGAGTLTALVTTLAIAREYNEAQSEAISSYELYKEEVKSSKESMAERNKEIRDEIAQLRELYSVEDKSTYQKSLMRDLVNDLNEQIPNLCLSYDGLTDSLNMTTDALMEFAREQAKLEEALSLADEITKSEELDASLAASVTEAQTKYGAAIDGYQRFKDSLAADPVKFGDVEGALWWLNIGVWEEKKYKEAVETAAEELKAAEDAYYGNINGRVGFTRRLNELFPDGAVTEPLSADTTDTPREDKTVIEINVNGNGETNLMAGDQLANALFGYFDERGYDEVRRDMR